MKTFYVQKDIGKAGTGDLYQIIELLNENEISILHNKNGSERYNQGDHYTDDALMEDISSKENIPLADIILEEI